MSSRWEYAADFPAVQLDTQGKALARAMAAHSPRVTGALTKSWRWERTSKQGGVVIGAKYANKVDRGGPTVSNRPLGLLVPLRSGQMRGAAAGGNNVTIKRRVRGLVAFVITRRTRRLVAVRKSMIHTRARPYIEAARLEWRDTMREQMRAAMRRAILGRK